MARKYTKKSGGGSGSEPSKKKREVILGALWGALEGGELSARERLEYMKELNKLESFYKKDEGEEVRVVIRSAVKCPACGEVIL